MRISVLFAVLMALLPVVARADSAPASAYGRLPLQFAANQGQTDPQVKFLARGSDSALFITPTGAALTLGQNKTILRLNLVGSRSGAVVTGEAPLAGRSNYLVGNDPRRWHVGIANYARVRCQGVYPGVDMVYYGSQQQLEFDFLLAPHADAGKITLAFDGAASVKIDAQGNLVAQTTAGPILWHKPNVYQEIGGKRRAVDGGYRLSAQNQAGFQIGAYDASKPLTIDPTCVYSTFLGGSGNDSGASIAADAAGNAYITGNTSSADFPTVNTGADVGYTGDIFVAKMAPDGSALLYSTYIGSPRNSYEAVDGIAVGPDGSVYVTGHTMSADFPITPGAFQAVKSGPPFVSATVFCNYNVFVVKLSPDGTRLLYSTFLGGSDSNLTSSIAVDGQGDAVVAGETQSPDFPVTPPGKAPSDRAWHAFVTKFNPQGTGLVYSLIFPEADRPTLAADRAGSVYLTGRTLSEHLSTTPGAFQTAKSHQANASAFAAKFDPQGNLEYCTYLNGLTRGDEECGSGIAVNAAGEAYVTGYTRSPDFPVVHAAQPVKGKGFGHNAFLTKISADGSELLFSTYLGGSQYDDAYGVAVDPQGNAWITGTALSPDFPVVHAWQPAHALRAALGVPTARTADLDFAHGRDAFVAKFSPDGALLFSTYLGGSDTDTGAGIAADGSGHVYVTGATVSEDFPVYHAGQSVKRHSDSSRDGYSENSNAFILKIADAPE